MAAFNEALPSQVQFTHKNKMPGFYFRKRVERIDWKRLASVDVCRVASQMDIDALQDNLVSVAFCDINSEIDTRYVDTNFIKLFQLAQLLIEYLLYSQDFLTNTVDALKLENETIKKETDALKRRLDQQAQRLTVTRKECHRRRLLLLAQQQLMDSGPQSYHQCPHCPKAFINASFLNAHLYRRHVEVVTALQAIDLNQDHIDRSDKGGNLQKEKPAIDKSSGLTSNLEHQIQEVLGHIKTQPPSLPPTQLASAIVQTVEVNEGSGDYHPPTLPPAPSPTATWKKRTAELERQLQEERERMRELEERNRAWQTSVAEQHRADVEHVREMFEVELRNLREENLQTQKELIQLRLKGANVSTFGDLEDDVPAQLERQVRSLEASPKRFKHRQDSETAHGTTKIVHIVEDNTCPVESTEQKLEKPLRTGKHDKGDVKSKDFNIELRIDPTEGVRPYKEQLEQLRQDPNALKRLRKEVEALLMEQLIDHDIQADARGLPRGKFNGTIDTLGQERQQLERKHPTFAEIRASLSRQVDRMALVALHSKRERREPLSGDGDGAASSSFKKPRASRSSERSISARPTSGRPASLTSITPTLSPIAERPRLAMVSPAMRRPNEAHSTQSLFEESEEEEVDSDVTAPVHKASPAVCGRTSVDVDASSVTAGVTHPPSHGTPAINITTTANNTTSTPLKSSLKNVRVQEVDLRSKSEDSRADLDHNVAQKKTSKVTVKPQVLGPPKSPENSDWDSSDDDDDDGDDDDFKLPSLKSQAPSRQVFQRPLDEEMEEEEDIDDILGGLSPGHSVKFRDRNPTENFNNNATEAKGADKNDDVDDVSVSSLLDDEISKSRVSPIRPKTSRGGRTPLAPGSGSFRSSGTIVSPLCPGASYTISTSQWDTTASQAEDIHRLGVRDVDDDTESDI